MNNNPFTDIPRKPFLPLTGRLAGADYIENLKKISVGAGSEVVRADRSGWWAGANKFADAPFKVDMKGNLYLESASGKLVIDAENNRIVVYDANGVAKILIGYQSGGF